MTQLIPAWRDGRLQPVEKLEAHRLGLRHPAVSVFLFGEDGAVLLQRRAAAKYHTPLLWANTVCTHPHWGEDPGETAQRRLREELGISGVPLAHAGRVEYRAGVGNGLTEHEVVDIFTGQAPAGLALDPNPEEVAETRWMTRAALEEAIASRPDAFTPWLRIYLAEHAATIFPE